MTPEHWGATVPLVPRPMVASVNRVFEYGEPIQPEGRFFLSAKVRRLQRMHLQAVYEANGNPATALWVRQRQACHSVLTLWASEAK